MSDTARSFLSTFTARQSARGREVAPLFAGLLEPAPAALEAATRPAAPAPRPDVHTTSRAAAAVVVVREDPAAVVGTLTACLDAAPCRVTARKIFRTLYALALQVLQVRGVETLPTTAVFHLPAELVMAHLEIGRTAFYDNLRQLTAAGLVHAEAHMGRLDGHLRNVATGTLWAVSLRPERVLSGHADPVRITAEDWRMSWRDLNADVADGRTVAALLGLKYKGKKADQDGVILPESETEQSLKSLKAEVGFKTLQTWTINPFLTQSAPDRETVRPPLAGGLEVVWALGDPAAAPRAERAVLVDAVARRLAAAFGDTEASLNFWRKLVWNITRGIDAGENYADDVAAVLVRVLRDVQHGTPVRNVGRVVVAALVESDLWDLLRRWEFNRVSRRPVFA